VPLTLVAPEAIERLWNPLVDVDFALGDDDQLD
jgi:hypothetical protein